MPYARGHQNQSESYWTEQAAMLLSQVLSEPHKYNFTDKFTSWTDDSICGVTTSVQARHWHSFQLDGGKKKPQIQNNSSSISNAES